MGQIPIELTPEDVRRMGAILEGIADRSDMSPEEIQALETAILALMAVNTGRAMQRAYVRLASAHNGEIPESVKADMRAHGIDIDALESDGDFSEG